MNKTVIALFLVVCLEAQNYEELLNQAIQNNVNLQLIQSQQEHIYLNGEIDRRYKNPNLELEIADFSSQFVTQSNSFGVRVGVSQSILLPHIQNDKRAITQKEIAVSKKEYSVERSNFIYNFNLKYLAYKKSEYLLQLQQQAIGISKKILDTVNSRYQEGAVPKSDYLEAKLDYIKMQNQTEELTFGLTQAKNELLKFSNITENLTVDSSHLFLTINNTIVHPLIELTKAQSQVSQAKLELLQHSVESIELFSELEREPEQDIFRVGVSIPLPTFNNRNEEKQLERIKIANHQLLLSNQERLLTLKVTQLTDENRNLEQLKERHQSLISSQEQLFSMYRESYVIAKVNLLKLQQVKEQRIATKRKILESNFAIELNSIKINYLQGAYSE
jgi:cobalt-zinc-cadmium efflux system outer membrane protein